MRSDNGAQLGSYEPPSVTCDGCGVVDGCDCEPVICPECGAKNQREPNLAEYLCIQCSVIFYDES